MNATSTSNSNVGLRVTAISRGGRVGLRMLVFALFAFVFGLLASASAAVADAAKEKEKGPAYRVVDVSLVYVGNPRLFKKPCVVDADRVYKAIPEYREILEKNLTDRDVRYHFLMKKASDKFARAVRALAKDSDYDLVAGTGAVVAATSDAPAIPVGTDGAISRLPAA